MEHLSQLRTALEKAEGRVNRLKSQLETAQTERDELTTALKVLERLILGTQSEERPNQSDSGSIIFQYVPTGRANAAAPREIIDRMRHDGKALGDDLVRTQLWRMSKRGELLKADGKYWREAAQSPTDTDPWEDDLANVAHERQAPDDLDDDVPF